MAQYSGNGVVSCCLTQRECTETSVELEQEIFTTILIDMG